MTITMNAALKPRNCSYDLRNMAASGGRTGSGREQLVFKDPGFWAVKYSFQIRTRAQALAYRALVTRLRTGENVVAKLFDKWQAASAPALGFEASLTADAAARATTLQLETVGLFLEEGTAFSIGNRLYRIVGIPVRIASAIHHTPDAEEPDPAVPYPDNPPAYPDLWTVNVLPPLRAAVAAGTAADFRNLTCLCRIENLTDGDLDLDLYRFADVTLPLIEAL